MCGSTMNQWYRPFGVISVAFMIGAAPGAGAQQGETSHDSVASRDNTAASTLQTARGPIEFVGLHRWTPRDVEDSLRIRAGFDLQHEDAHACAADLRYKLHFADAAVFGYRDSVGHYNWLITLTEPQDSALVHYRALPRDTTGGTWAWTEPRALLKAHRAAFVDVIATAMLPDDSVRGSYVLPTGADSVAFVSLRRFVVAHQSRRDERKALEALRRDPNRDDRQIAVALLMPMVHEDTTWTALAQALLEQEGPVKAVAVQALSTRIAAGQRPHRWGTVAPAFHSILDGTSQFMMPEVLRMLVALKADTAQAEPLLHGGGHLLIAYAGVHQRQVRELALHVLRSLSGQDFGTDVGRWQSWVATL
jgi:hypothetical protein